MVDPSGLEGTLEGQSAAMITKNQLVAIVIGAFAIAAIAGTRRGTRVFGPSDAAAGLAFQSFANNLVMIRAFLMVLTNLYRNRPEEHHTVPKYLCGAEDQKLSSVPWWRHKEIHAALAGATVMTELGNFYVFGSRRTSAIKKLAETTKGRMLIAGGIEMVYDALDVWPEGEPSIEEVFKGTYEERDRFIGGISSCPAYK